MQKIDRSCEVCQGDGAYVIIDGVFVFCQGYPAYDPCPFCKGKGYLSWGKYFKNVLVKAWIKITGR